MGKALLLLLLLIAVPASVLAWSRAPSATATNTTNGTTLNKGNPVTHWDIDDSVAGDSGWVDVSACTFITADGWADITDRTATGATWKYRTAATNTGNCTDGKPVYHDKNADGARDVLDDTNYNGTQGNSGFAMPPPNSYLCVDIDTAPGSSVHARFTVQCLGASK